MFKIVFTKLVQWLIPAWIRQPLFTLLVLSCNWPLREVYAMFEDYRDGVFYKLEKTGQVCFLRAVLNDSFDIIERRINVIDFNLFGTTYLWPDAFENKVVYLNEVAPLYLFPDDVGYDFTVQVPTALIVTDADLARLRAKINEFKMDGKQFFIEKI